MVKFSFSKFNSRYNRGCLRHPPVVISRWFNMLYNMLSRLFLCLKGYIMSVTYNMWFNRKYITFPFNMLYRACAGTEKGALNKCSVISS